MGTRQSQVTGPTKQINTRYPEALHAKLAASAARNNRSINAEILYRIEQSFKNEGVSVMTITMQDVVEKHGDFAHGGDVEYGVKSWERAGFTPEEADAWLEARCFEAVDARRLADAGITPEQAAQSDEEIGGYVDTIGYKVANGDLSVERAKEAIGA
ncbi:Arc family DNA-binding protein [Alicyclobacillus acidoterrestris]|uniref:Arc family DNA-binding protein n=1 Tax=Alicyclobacillus TaxID=29330 RepID=UPI001A8F9FF1|nr:Arc family DNA-binding protein [Alicyclobacillus suci]